MTTLSDYASYYCRSLEDIDLAQGGLALADLRSWEKLPTQHLLQGRVSATLLQQLFHHLIGHQSTLNVVIRPIVYELPVSYKNKPGIQLSRFIAPITTIAQLKPNGRLYPVKSFIARDLFEPTRHGVYTIGTLKELDRFLRECERIPSVFSSHPQQDTKEANTQWSQYLSECQKAIETVCQHWINHPEPYVRMDYAFICPQKSQQSIHAPIKALYNYINEHLSIELPLFETFVSDKASIKQECLPLHAHFTKRLVSTEEGFSYTPSQRHALAHMIEQQDAEILAINTPPDTGKIVLIKAAVANQWALAASQNKEPPISIVISNNTESLEKISNSFGRNFLRTNRLFEGRWLPDFGQKLSQQTNSLEKIFDPQLAEFSDLLFADFETQEYHQKAKENYLINVQLNFPQIKTDTIQSILEFLQDRIQENIAYLTSLEKAWNSITHVSQKLDIILGDAPQEVTVSAQKTLDQLTLEMEELAFFAQSWENYQHENYKFSPFFTLLPSYSEKQLRESLSFLNSSAPIGISFNNCKSINEINKKINGLLEQKNTALAQAQVHVEGLQKLLSTEKIHSIDWAEAIIDLLASSGFDNIKDIAEAENAADQTVRFDIFQLVTHYWEGRWLLEMEKLFDYPEAYYNTDNPLAILKKWQLRMMLVPCMGTTCHKLPLFFQTKSDLRKDYLFNAIDLLIVDQAEQISPELSAASFMLAKKALVFGDTLQTDMLPLQGRYMDTANLQNQGLVPLNSPEQEFLKLSSLGKTASLGNVMRIAQTSSRYHQIPQLSAGLFLTEQVASYNEIVQLSNTLCYQGALTPTRGRKIEVAMQQKKILEELPPIGYVHVDGFSLKTSNSGYSNIAEAYTIAHWLNHRKQELEQYYQKPLRQIVSIATPYPSQVKTIIEALQEFGVNTNEHGSNQLLVCTSYAQQSSSFPIVIFSNIFSKHLLYPPITRDTKLFNAAISHARDAFLLFADMHTIENALSATPRGMLAQALLPNDKNKIECPPQRRHDLLSYTDHASVTTKELKTPQEHHVFFREALSSPTVQEVHIACPALELCEISTFIINELKKAIERGVSVHIYTDIPSLMHHQAAKRPLQKSQQLEKIIQSFKDINIPVQILPKIHTNLLICDKHIYCTGLYQWLNMSNLLPETPSCQSIAYYGNNLSKEIEVQKNALQNKIIRF